MKIYVISKSRRRYLISTDGVDIFGIKKIRPDDPSRTGENWFMGDLTNDPRVKLSGTVKNLGNGVFEGHVTTADNPDSFRINVRTTNPKAFDIDEQKKIGLDWKKRLQAQCMIDKDKDFRHVEMTAYWKVTQWTASDEFSPYVR